MKGLIFSPYMLSAWREGRQTVTRRLMKPQPNPIPKGPSDHNKIYTSGWFEGEPVPKYVLDKAPYRPGEIVYIKERLVKSLEAVGKYWALYESDYEQVLIGGPAINDGVQWEWKRDRLPAMFMPAWAARDWARIVSVRAEELQEINEIDAYLEGFRDQLRGNTFYSVGAQFKETWDSLYGPGSWDSNPWVWRYELERIGKP
jgi:hypothetical protein